MALLNLMKSKEGAPAKEEVPDELPSLPDDKKEEAPAEEKPAEAKEEAPAEEKKEEPKAEEAPKEEAPAEEPKEEAPTEEKKEEPKAEEAPKEEPKLAPDELPPISEETEEAPAEEPEQAEPEQPETVVEGKKPDEKLYFSQMINRFNDGKSKHNVEQEILHTDPHQIIHNLNTDWDNQKQEESLADSLADLDKKIMEKMKPLQTMEQEWRLLRSDIDDKTKSIIEKEAEIKKLTSELKELLRKKSEFK